MDDPSSLPEWSEGLIYADAQVNYEEWEALQELNLEDPEEFLADFWHELTMVHLQYCSYRYVPRSAELSQQIQHKVF